MATAGNQKEYASLSELKHTRRRGDDTDDAVLQNRLVQASRAIDRRCGRVFWLEGLATPREFETHGRVVRRRGERDRLIVDDVGSLDDLVVEVGQGTSWAPVAYDVYPPNALAKGEPITSLQAAVYWGGWGQERVRVTARWGWPAVPDDISGATLLLANRLYMRKDSSAGLLGSTEWGVARVPLRDPDAEAMVAPYELVGF